MYTTIQDVQPNLNKSSQFLISFCLHFLKVLRPFFVRMILATVLVIREAKIVESERLSKGQAALSCGENGFHILPPKY